MPTSAGAEFLDQPPTPLAGWKQALPRIVDNDGGLVFEARDGVGLMWGTTSWGWKWAYEDDFPQRAAALTDTRSLYA